MIAIAENVNNIPLSFRISVLAHLIVHKLTVISCMKDTASKGDFIVRDEELVVKNNAYIIYAVPLIF